MFQNCLSVPFLRRGASCAFLTIGLHAAPALAQAVPDGDPLLSEGVGAATEAPAEAILVTASRSGEGVPLSRLGASATVLSPAQLEQRQTRIVSDILRDVPGVAVSRAGGVGGLTQLRLRGTEGNHVLVLIDGIEAADPYQGEFDFGSLIVEPAARIEVLRGQQSSLYGSDAIGGVVHYMTLTGAEAPGISARAEAGSFGTVNSAARVAGVAGGLDYSVSGAFYDTNGTPTARGGTRDIGAEIVNTSGKLIWRASPHLTLTGVARYSHAEADQNDTDNDPASPLFGTIVDSPGVSARSEALQGLVSLEHKALAGRWTNRLTGQIADFTRDGFGPDGRTSGNEGQRLKGSFVSSLGLSSGTAVHRLTGAVDVERERFRTTTPSPFAFIGERQIDAVGLVGQYELFVGEALALGASVRHDANERFDDVTTWRVQGSYALPTATRLHAAWGTGVKNPGYFDLYGYTDGRYIGNPELRPEKSLGWEIGAEQRIGAIGHVGITFFDSRLEDEIVVTYPAPHFVATPANRAELSNQHGIEAYLHARPMSQLRLDATYTWLEAEEDGTTEARRPRHIASANATVLTRDERLSGTLTLRYNGEQVDLAYTDPSYVPVRELLDEYWLVNLNAAYRLTPAITFTGRIENLLDEEYEEVFSYATPGLSAHGGVQISF